MRVIGRQGAWQIARDWTPPRYFCFLVDSDKACWSRYPDRATRFDVRAAADSKLTELRSREKAIRERFLSVKPKPLAKYCWTAADKKLLGELFALGCKPQAMAIQFGRTAAACVSMYHLILKGDQR